MRLAVILSMLPVLAAAPPPDPKSFIPRLEKNLRENIVRFWYPRSLDRENGGYHMHFGPNGERKNGTKAIVVQARMLWLFSRLAREGYQPKEMLEAAELGYRFLRDQMWDKEHGGFFWEVDATGKEKLKQGKHMYGQAFGLYAVSEYAMASRRSDVLEFANQIFRLFEEKAHDSQYGGYIEFFSRDWKTPPPGEQTYMGGGEPSMKLMNTHLHLMEAMTTYYRASKLPLARERLLELMTIESNSVVRKDIAACTDKYDRDWKPRLEDPYARVSYGHDIENIWLLVEAAEVAGVPVHPWMDLHKAVFAYSRKYGYDEEKGGFYDSGPFLKPADRRAKVWWVQSEALVSALTMYKLTRDASYWEVFEKTLDFVDKYQTDWKVGEWHATVTPDGRGTGDKGHNWKAGYHNGRAMLECLAILKSL